MREAESIWVGSVCCASGICSLGFWSCIVSPISSISLVSSTSSILSLSSLSSISSSYISSRKAGSNVCENGIENMVGGRCSH